MKNKKAQAKANQVVTKGDIESLARLVGRGFDRLEGSIDGRFVRLEDKIAEFRQETAVRFNGTNKKIDG